MAVTDLPVLDLIKSTLKWHQQRQRVLAENVANADMPGFVPRDLKAPESAGGPRVRVRPVEVAMTNRMHITGHGMANGGAGPAGTVDQPGWEATPDGNSVVLEEQMMKVAENQMDFEMATTLYSRSLAILRSAVRQG
jgi:flagellar basal-body rod protein FlgB